jgi:hypothetical protein
MRSLQNWNHKTLKWRKFLEAVWSKVEYNITINYTNSVGYCSGFVWLRVRSSPGHLWVTWRNLWFYKISTLLNKLFVIISNFTSSVYYKNLTTKPLFVTYFLFCIATPIGAMSVENTEHLLKLVIDFLHIQHVILVAAYANLCDIFWAIWLYLTSSIFTEPMKNTAQSTRNFSECTCGLRIIRHFRMSNN